MANQFYKEECGRLIAENSELKTKVKQLQDTLLELRIHLAEVTDEFIENGGDPKQLEIFE